MSEEEVQIALVDWFKLQYPKAAKKLHHSPNEGKHKVQYRVKQKKMGVSSGFSDLILVQRRGGFTGLAIELKADKGPRPTADQFDWLDSFAEEGWFATWAKGYAAAQSTIKAYMALPRDKVSEIERGAHGDK